jgi:hypothetical protein
MMAMEPSQTVEFASRETYIPKANRNSILILYKIYFF